MSNQTERAYSRGSVRLALAHFLGGKLISGGLALVNLLILIRVLEPSHFAVYSALFAFQMLVLASSSFGIEPSVERYLPELKTLGTPLSVVRLTLAGVLARFLSLMGVLFVIWISSGWVCKQIGLVGWSQEFNVFLGVVLLGGLLQLLIATLEALLLQRLAQYAQAFVSAARLVATVIFISTGPLTVMSVIVAELASVVAGLSVCIGATTLQWLSARRIAYEKPISLASIRARMVRYAAYNYGAQLLMMGFSLDAAKLITVKSLGLIDAAIYGFVASLIEQINKYLPAVLLIRLIRPIFISRYSENGDFSQINRFSTLVLKLNLILLVPAIGMSAIGGDGIGALVSGGKYENAGALMTLLLLLLVPISHQWVISMIANTLEINQLQFFGSAIAVSCTPITVILVQHFGVVGAPLGLLLSAALYNSFAVVYLRRKGFAYRVDLLGLSRIGVAGFLAAAVAWAIGCLVDDGGARVVAEALAVGSIYLIFLVLLRPFTRDELSTLSGFLPGKVVRLIGYKQ